MSTSTNSAAVSDLQHHSNNNSNSSSSNNNNNSLAVICISAIKQEEGSNPRPSMAAQPLSSRPPAVSMNPGPSPYHSQEMEMEKEKEKHNKKGRSKNWTRQETLKLIRHRTELEPRFARTGRKSELWDEISEALKRENICRDAQQCRDKWEKLMASYKEVRDGLRQRDDNPFFDELDPLLSVKSATAKQKDKEALAPVNRNSSGDNNFPSDDEETAEEGSPPTPKRRKAAGGYVMAAEVEAVTELLESLVSRQQQFFAELLDSMDRKEQMREQIRQEKEEKWRAEERAQRCIFHNAMIVLTKKLMDGSGGLEPLGFEFGAGLKNSQQFDGGSGNGGSGVGVSIPGSVMRHHHQVDGGRAAAGGGGRADGDGGGGGVVTVCMVPKKRSKNWKRVEVLQLIKFRAEMEARFAKSTRRAALWDELAELLGAEGIKRDGKQCREKWDKLMAEFKDVSDGKRDRSESPYFTELTSFVGRSAEAG
ncbi:hypothetical protein SUGI_0240840 [Cryptomeria japonica]|uniref:trihelix transcription factor DF1 isoform X2 n=1 Tax=Cryptomeria japonica TaxID=3369 RepID=UPI0024089E5C|nr:trihelix transcription factor DF1 isoform X2 [Cryptomeria japonica]GLJ14813.1 hypothetical protein SUGI_0240840 [Cryptomeria japonica]